MNKNKGIKNIVWGIAAQIITIGVGLIIPRLVLVNLGSEANGLLNSIGNIITYLSLLEAGVGVASVQALYLPISKDDRNRISQIMSATNYYYRRTGRIYLLLVLILSLVYTLLVQSAIPKFQVFLVILLSGLTGVINYFFQGKYKILLSAEGKNYIITNITTILSVVTSLTKALVLVLGGNVVMVQSVYFVINLIQMAIFVVYMRKHYGWVNYNDKPDLEAVAQSKDVLVHQISGMIFNNTDVLVLTILTTLKEVSIYSMYAMIFGMVKAIVVVFTESYVYALGQSFHNKPIFFKIFDAYETGCLTAAGALFCITNIMVLPFLRLYTSGITDANYIDPYLPWMFTVFYLLHHGRASSSHIINIAQRFKETKWRAILEAVINIASSLLFTYFFGIYGVVLGTIIALLYRSNDMVIYASRILDRSSLITYKRWIVNIALMAILSVFFKRIPYVTNNYLQLIRYGIIVGVTVVPSFIIVNSIMEPAVAKYAYSHIRELINKRIR